jgi:hypothetical protein
MQPSNKITKAAVMLADGSMFIYGQDEQPGMAEYRWAWALGAQLGNINRFCGALNRNISVAAHSLMAETMFSEDVADSDKNSLYAEKALAILLHDVAEIIQNDIPGPYLRFWRTTDPVSYSKVYEAEKNRFERTILKRMKLPEDLFIRHSSVITSYDVEALLAEATLMPYSDHYAFNILSVDRTKALRSSVECTDSRSSDFRFSLRMSQLLEIYRKSPEDARLFSR